MFTDWEMFEPEKEYLLNEKEETNDTRMFSIKSWKEYDVDA